MKFSDIASRITGFSVPIFGASWNPPESQRSIARRIIAELEDRRVLYSLSEQEVPQHCIDSVRDIRRMLSRELGNLADGAELADSLRAMRIACRRFMDRLGPDAKGLPPGVWGTQSWIFNAAIGELRAIFGVHLLQVATKYGLDIEDDLASILPLDSDD